MLCILAKDSIKNLKNSTKNLNNTSNMFEKYFDLPKFEFLSIYPIYSISSFYNTLELFIAI